MDRSRLFVGQSYRSKTQAVSWIGEAPWLGGVPVFGTDEGRVIIAPGHSYGRHGKQIKAAFPISQEAVNCAAFLDDFGAASSRSDVFLWKKIAHTVSEPEVGERTAIRHTKQFPIGAHNVIALPYERAFAFSMNTGGIYFLSPDESGVQTNIFRLEDEAVPFYKIAHVRRHPHEGDVLAVACREDGFCAFTHKHDKARADVVRRSLTDHDIVDIQAVGLGEPFPHAVVALSSTGELIFVPDVLNPESPRVFKPESDIGDVYGLLVVNSTILILTEDSIICFPTALKGWMQGPQGGSKTPEACAVRFEGALTPSDILPYGKRDFAIIENDRAIVFNLNSFLKSIESRRSIATSVIKSSRTSGASALSAKFKVDRDSYLPTTSPWETYPTRALDRTEERYDSFAVV